MPSKLCVTSGERPIRFSAHWCADYSKYRGFLAGSISTASSLLPFFGTRLRRQNSLISHPQNTASHAGYFFLGPFISGLFAYSLVDLLTQLSARFRSLAVLLHSRFVSPFRSTIQCWGTRFSLLWVFGPGFNFWQLSGFSGTY